MQIATVLIASTAHLKASEASALIEGYGCKNGFLFPITQWQAPEEMLKGHPSPSLGLRGALIAAKEAKCDYLMLDADGYILDDVATYAWF